MKKKTLHLKSNLLRCPASCSHKSRWASRKRLVRTGFKAVCAAGGFLALSQTTAYAMTLYSGSDSGNPYTSNIEINLSTTLSYSLFTRVNNPSAILAGPTNANSNDGDSDLRHGIIGNEFEVLPILDIKDGNYGLHFSGDAYINTVYLQETQNNQKSTFNSYSVSNREYTNATTNENGHSGEMLDAFVYGTKYFGAGNQQSITVKVGRQALLWGQSLFFTNNGIAAGQAPVDVNTASSLPNPQAQQVFLPVGQAVITYQPNSIVTFQGYYQFQWEPYNFAGVGSYFNNADIFGGQANGGGERLIAGPGYLFRAKDLTPPSQNGQFGLSAQLTLGNYDLGFYALRYDSKLPEIYAKHGVPTPTSSGLSLGNYYLVYPRDIQIYGTSLSTTIGAANVAGEISGRRNMPLDAGGLTSTPSNPGNASSDPLYPVGDTLHAQASLVYLSPGIPLDSGGVSIASEVEANHVLDITANKAALAPYRSSTAATLELVVTPTYYEVIPNLNLSFPVGILYNFYGRSETDSGMNNGTGQITAGINATYKVVWTASLSYKDYFGAPSPTYNPFADRGYVSFNLQRAF